MTADSQPVITVVARTGDRLGEVPGWDAAEGALYWVDIEGRVLYRHKEGTPLRHWSFPERIGAYALCEAGGFIVALESGIYLFDGETDALTLIAQPETNRPGNRMNDGKCDPQGRFWVGSMDDSMQSQTAALYRVDSDLTVTRVLDGVGISNSIAVSPDESCFYFADSLVREIRVYDYEPLTGALEHERLFSACEEHNGNPDGATVDDEGFLWSAVWDEGCLIRYAPDGRIDKRVPLPVAKPTSCCFGGPDRGTMFVTTAIWDLDDAEAAGQPLAGAVLSFRPGITGPTAVRFRQTPGAHAQKTTSGIKLSDENCSSS